ncbi:MAG: rhomboid family intramembrane serine protease [Actinomycetota bacterium]|nr:rhomboid family intramembrane serine protease [Actinomycetota bacterium]
MIPLKDYNPTRRFPLITVLLIAANIYVYFLVQRPSEGDARQLQFSLSYAAIPCELVQGEPLSEREVVRTFGRANDSEACDNTGTDESPLAFPDKQIYLASFYSMFLHGSLLHIAGNMLFLWVFGNNIEDRMGIPGYIAFYLAAGLAATAAHVLVQPNSTIPVVGASGAIAGVMGAYLVLFPDVRIRSLIVLIFLVFFRDIAAKWLLGFWFVSQFFTNPNEGVAWVAHVGGFVFGAFVALLLRDRLRPARQPSPLY